MKALLAAYVVRVTTSIPVTSAADDAKLTQALDSAIEGLDAASEPVGHRFTWAFGDIARWRRVVRRLPDRRLLVRRRLGGAESVMIGARRGVVNVRPRTGSACRADAGRWSFVMDGFP